MTKTTDIAWAAGFFDGEGSIQICRNQPNRDDGGHFYLRIEVGQVRRLPLDAFVKLFGGTIRTRARKNGLADVHIWLLSGAKAAAALEQMSPYLKLKKRHAQLALTFQVRRPGRGRILYQQAWVKDQRDYIAMKELNSYV
jgi:hypothetical protein